MKPIRVAFEVIVFSLAAVLLIAAARANGETIQWVVAGTDSHPTGQTVPPTPALLRAVSDAIASTQPTIPPVVVPATPPVTQPTTVPVPPVVIVPPPVTPTAAQTAGTASWKLPLDDQGWVAWAPAFVDVVVSPSGNDANPGTADKPVKTLARAGKLLPFDKPYTLWLEAGGNYGSLPNLPSGTRARPNVVRTKGAGRATVGMVAIGNKTGLAIVDLNVRGGGIGMNAGVSIFKCNGVWVEGCDVTNARDGITAQGVCSDIVIRRNVVHDNSDKPTNAQHAQGTYFDQVKGGLISSNVFDCNGWQPGTVKPTIFNQTVYVTGTCDGIDYDNNLVANPAATGIQARSGGNVSYNVFLGCPNSLSWGLVNGGGPQHKGGVSGDVGHNLFQGSRDIAGQQRGTAMMVGNVASGHFHHNYFADGPDLATAYAISLERGDGVFQADSVGVHNLLIEQCYTLRFARGIRQEPELRPGPAGYQSLSNVVVLNSVFGAPGYLSSGVSVKSPSAPKAFPTADDYAKKIGLGGWAGWVKAARGQSRQTWRSDLEPRSAVQWVESQAK